MVSNKAIVQFINKITGQNVELEIPINITANDLIIALNEAFHLEMDVNNIFNCYLLFYFFYYNICKISYLTQYQT